MQQYGDPLQPAPADPRRVLLERRRGLQESQGSSGFEAGAARLGLSEQAIRLLDISLLKEGSKLLGSSMAVVEVRVQEIELAQLAPYWPCSQVCRRSCSRV